ncbi:hypothetical protein [Alcanivorax sp.]|uniref:hypothetical protein n=1 Tax=Alcanivorax sp. TaxID=1872427 RepID=UPI0025C43EA5|nr:hypothetical protein [Alcanivorax sp.]
MRHLTLMAFAALALAGCNGGEDFSDATVPGCPLGANCDLNPRGEVLVELQGPRVANLGYSCGNSTGYTRAEEVTLGNVVVPPFHALCPANSGSIEFYIGSGLFEGNNASLGRYLLPQQLRKGTYQVTLADLSLANTITSPRRVALKADSMDATSSVLNRSALLHALNEMGNDPDQAIIIPGNPAEKADAGDPNTILDAQPDLAPDSGFAGTDYEAFKAAWQGFIDRVNTESPTDGFDTDTTNYQTRLELGNDRSRAGLYAFEIAGECIILEGCEFGGEAGSTVSFTLNALVLPDGGILGGGTGVRASNDQNQILDYLGFDSNAGLSDLLELQNQQDESLAVDLLSRDIGDAPADNTQGKISGRFLGSSLYAGVEIDGRSDFKLDFPGSATALDPNDKGEINGKLLNEALDPESPLPFRATKTGFVQALPDSAIVSDLAGTYTIRLMRACVDDDLGNDDANCSDIVDPTPDTPDVNEEISDSGGNYPQIIGGEIITRERFRLDENSVDEFCLVISSEGQVSTGVAGACDTTYTVGFVTRTFSDPKSANVSLRLAPGLDVAADIPHFNATIEGRIDLAAGGCAPMYRLSDENFEIGLRARWVEDSYLPRLLLAELGEDRTAAEDRRVASLVSGAVQFFEGAPGDSCDPMAPAP